MVAPDSFAFSLRDIGRYCIKAGQEIIVTPFAGASERNLRLALLGSAFGALCHQRGLIPLHANAIVAGGRAFAFGGRSGIGKSTLSAHFQSRGYSVLCDDVCVISFGEDGTPLAWPGLPRVQLWRDAADALGFRHGDLEQAVDGYDKYAIPLGRRPAGTGPLPLDRLYILRFDTRPAGQTGIARLTGAAALQAALRNVYRRNYLGPMGLGRANFEQMVRLTQRAPIYAAPRRKGYDVFSQEAARLEQHLLLDPDDSPAALHGGPIITGAEVSV